MTASLTATELRSQAWFLHAEFHVASHQQIVDITAKRIIPEYVQNIIATRAPYFNKHLKAWLSCQSQCQLKCLPYATGKLCLCLESLMTRAWYSEIQFRPFLAVLTVSARHGPLCISVPARSIHDNNPSLNDHTAFIVFLAKNSLGLLGGMDKTLQFRFHYEGISDAGQETIKALAERTRSRR
jgi:hypothetical protein